MDKFTSPKKKEKKKNLKHVRWSGDFSNYRVDSRLDGSPPQESRGGQDSSSRGTVSLATGVRGNSKNPRPRRSHREAQGGKRGVGVPHLRVQGGRVSLEYSPTEAEAPWEAVHRGRKASAEQSSGRRGRRASAAPTARSRSRPGTARFNRHHPPVPLFDESLKANAPGPLPVRRAASATRRTRGDAPGARTPGGVRASGGTGGGVAGRWGAPA